VNEEPALDAPSRALAEPAAAPALISGFLAAVDADPMLRASMDGLQRLIALGPQLDPAYARNTQRAWVADMRIWMGYCLATGTPVLPATLDGLRGFLEDGIARGRKRATLNRYLSTLATAHELAELPWPLHTRSGKLMWQGLRKQLSKRQDQATGLTVERIEAVIAALDVRQLRDARDAALLQLAWETMARASELVGFSTGDVSAEPDGTGRILIGRSKTDQEGEGALLNLSVACLARVRHWTALAGLEEGPLFRSVPYRKNQLAGGPLSERDVSRIFRRLVGRAELGLEKISAHSTRVGAAQDLLAADYALPRIMQQGRWKTPRMVLHYGERIDAGRSAMADFTSKRRKRDE